MAFTDDLMRSVFIPRLRGTDKGAVLAEMVAALADAGRVGNRESALAAILRREAEMSTGIRDGVALPHGRDESVRALEVLIALHPGGIDFDSMDGLPSRIFVMTLSPPDSTGLYLPFLSAIGRLLDRPAVRKAVLNARDRHGLLSALS